MFDCRGGGGHAERSGEMGVWRQGVDLGPWDTLGGAVCSLHRHRQ